MTLRAAATSTMRASNLASLVTAVAISSAISFNAHAVPINSPVPSNAYISFNGADWAWANPCAATGCSAGLGGIDLTYQSTQGWRLPTLAELALAPEATDFLFAGANVPFQGTDPVSGAHFQLQTASYLDAQSDGACATPYFSVLASHCDWGNAPGSSSGQEKVWYGDTGSEGFSETLVIRGEVVPEPSTLALFAAGLAGVAVIRRRRKASAGRASGSLDVQRRHFFRTKRTATFPRLRV